MNTIGCDVELFARNEVGFRSLCGLIGGTKESPLQIPGLPNGFCVQEDNVSLEFNIPPATGSYEFEQNLVTISSKVKDILTQHGLTVSKDCSVSFPKEELLHPNALIFGCEPDYNAWTMMENEKPYAEDKTLRTAGGHIHVGTQANMINVVKWMDVFLGVPSIIIDDNEGSVRRRELYGKAGAMRPKPYGLEYRVLSNFWVFKIKTIRWVYEMTANAVQHAQKKAPSTRLQSQVIKAINNGDKQLAQKIIQSVGIELP